MKHCRLPNQPPGFCSVFLPFLPFLPFNSYSPPAIRHISALGLLPVSEERFIPLAEAGNRQFPFLCPLSRFCIVSRETPAKMRFSLFSATYHTIFRCRYLFVMQSYLISTALHRTCRTTSALRVMCSLGTRLSPAWRCHMVPFSEMVDRIHSKCGHRAATMDKQGAIRRLSWKEKGRQGKREQVKAREGKRRQVKTGEGR